jgi:hypothetical protein
MAARKHPSVEMLKDLNKVFTKYGWSGEAIGMRDRTSDDDSGDCPNGKIPKDVTYKLPDGTWATKTICV